MTDLFPLKNLKSHLHRLAWLIPIFIQLAIYDLDLLECDKLSHK